jgi:hypothetical protein
MQVFSASQGSTCGQGTALFVKVLVTCVIWNSICLFILQGVLVSAFCRRLSSVLVFMMRVIPEELAWSKFCQLFVSEEVVLHLVHVILRVRI